MCLVMAVLAIGSAAQGAASVTWHFNWEGNSAHNSLEFDDWVNDTWVYGETAAALGSKTITAGDVSATFTDTLSGFSISGSGGPVIFVEASRFFTLSGLADGETVTAAFNFSPPASSALIVEMWTTNYGGSWNTLYSVSGIVTHSQQLGNGTYHVGIAGYGDDLGNGGTFAAFTIPEPTTMLLLGLGGLLLRKRRV